MVIAAACNSETILAANLSRSPLLDHVPLQTEWGAGSAAHAYNRALDATSQDIVVFAHQDVFLPRGWEKLLARRIAEVAAIDPDWALIGAFGVGADGPHYGPVWSSSLGMIVGRVPLSPIPALSYDELLIVLRRRSGLRFDTSLPGWHLYGTDIVTEARRQGLGAWITALPCIHNDRYHGVLGQDYVDCYRAMQRKWAGQLPLRSPIIKISRSGLHLWRDRWQAWRDTKDRLGMAIGTDTPVEQLAALCGWSDLTACA